MVHKFGVRVMPREVILDTQGRAVEQTLEINSMKVESCRVGKYIEVSVKGDESQAQAQVEKIAKTILHNPLIENFEIEKL